MKIQRLVLGIALALASSGAAQTCDQWVSLGRTNLAAHYLSGANAFFSNAVAQCPNDPNANVFYAATRLLSLPSQAPLDNFLTRLGMGAASRDLYYWTARFSINASGYWLVPPGVNANEAPALYRANVLPQIIAADANLAKVTNPGFLLDLTSNDTAVAAVTLDYGDILMMRAMLQAGEFLGYVACSVNSDITLTNAEALLTNRTLGVQRLLADYPQLLTFATTNDLAAAKQAFMNAVDLYVQASAFIRSRPINVTRLFNYDPTMQTEELDFRETILDLKSSLTNPVVWRVYSNYTFNLANAFDGSYLPRNFLPALTNNLIIEGTFPDPTFGGVISGLSEAKIDDFLVGRSHVKGPDARWWMVAKSRNFVQSSSSAPAPDPAEPFSFSAMVAPNAPGSVINADLTPPGGVLRPLPAVWLLGNYYSSWSTNFSTNLAFNAQADLEAAYPNGVYGMTIYATNDGTRSVALALQNDLYPNAPHISNFDQLQPLAGWQDFVLRWDPMIGGTTNDFIQVKISVNLGGDFNDLTLEVFRTPDLWDVNALDGTATSVTIPANQLGLGGTYTATITFTKVTDSDRTTFLAARGVAAYTATTSATIQTTDLRCYSIAKGQSYTQTSAAAPALSAGQPFAFQAFVDDYWNVTSLTVQAPPGGAVESTNGSGSLALFNSFGSQPDLDAAFPNGNYTMTINSSLMGTRTAVLSLTNDAYPKAPRISNYAAAQHIDGTTKFVLTWDAFPGGTTNDFIQVSLGPSLFGGPLGSSSFSAYSGTPAYGAAGALDGTATNWVISRKQLYAGMTYQATLLFVKGVGTNPNGYPGAPGIAGYYAMTTFQIHADQGLPSPDLAPLALTWANAPAADLKQPLQVAVTVTNQGTADASWWQYDFYLTRDGTIAASDTPLPSQYSSYPMLHPGASITDTFSLTLDSVPATNCFLVVRLTSGMPEVRTDNNILAVPIMVSGPDLAAMSLNCSSVAEPSSWINVSWAVTNVGTQAASNYWGGGGWDDSIYLSTNANGQNGRQLGSYYYSDGPLAPGDGYARTNSIRLSGLAAGNYYLSLKVDDYANVREVGQTNNLLVRRITLTAPAAAPDLAPLALVANAPAIAGMPLPITITVTNQGTADAVPSWNYDVYLSSVPQWDASAYLVGSGGANGSLAAGETLSLDTTVNLPGDQYGSKFLIVRLDTQDDIYELNEANNMLAMPLTITVGPPVITQPPYDGRPNLGQYLDLYVGVAGTLPFHYQWRKESVNIPGATRQYFWLPSVKQSDSGHYDVIVSNAVGVVTSSVATVTVNVALADTFNPGADNEVDAFAIQPDGKILVGGWFSMLGGQSCTNLGRLNADGTIDTSFNSGTDGGLYCMALQGDGKILVGGQFNTLGGHSCTNLGRLNADGTIDTDFNSGAGGVIYSGVYSLALQDDGKVLVGGQFNTLGGHSCTNLGRLNADGTIDTNFNAGADSEVDCLALQADGKILVGGWFDKLSGQSCAYLGRLNADGTLDANFNSGADSGVSCLAVQTDGKILVGGDFSMLGWQSCASLGRLNADGTIDTSFNSGADGWVSSLAVQTDGKILVGGQFTMLGGQSCTNLGWLNGDGTLVPGFNPITDANSDVTALGLQVDGKVLVGGNFSMLAGQYRNNLGRLINTDPATQDLSFDGSTITWLRGGTSPEVGRVTFDYSTDGVSWTPLGQGTNVVGGWQLGGLALSGSGRIRARGQVSGGEYNGSGWYVESVSVPPYILVAPVSQTAGSGEPVWLSVAAGGSTLSYQWRKDGADIAGATDSIYLIPGMQGDDAGSYSVVVSNSRGSITSSPPAVLAWANPEVLITSGPADGARIATSVVNLVGQVGDSIALEAVEWQLSNASGTTAWQPASGTTNWSATIANLAVGRNTVRVRARHGSGYGSAVVSRSWLLLTPLTINISGCGAVSPGFSGTTFLQAGAAYSVTASPCGGYTFSAWSGGASGSTPSLNFVMRKGLVLNVAFVQPIVPPPRYTPVNGTYTGLFYDTNGVAQESSGLFTLTVTTTRKPPTNHFSGNLRIGNSRWAFTGQFDGSGHANVTIKRTGLAAVTMHLQVDTASRAAWLVGSIGDMTWIAELVADRAMFNARTNPATEFAGKYTMVIPGSASDAEPQGDGFGAVNVSQGGTVTLMGRLADGTAISQSAPLSMNGEWPLYIPLYSGKGSLLGWINFASRAAQGDQPADDLHGQLSWIKPANGSRYYPAGFSDGAVMAAGQRYTPPTRGQRIIEVADGLVTFGGGALTAPFANTVTISTANKVQDTSANRLSMSFTTSSGLFSGSVAVPGTKHSFLFNGVVLQGRDVGLGYFLDNKLSGSVRLAPQ